jgi:hypothetical protein
MNGTKQGEDLQRAIKDAGTLLMSSAPSQDRKPSAVSPRPSHLFLDTTIVRHLSWTWNFLYPFSRRFPSWIEPCQRHCATH